MHRGGEEAGAALSPQRLVHVFIYLSGVWSPPSRPPELMAAMGPKILVQFCFGGWFFCLVGFGFGFQCTVGSIYNRDIQIPSLFYLGNALTSVT